MRFVYVLYLSYLKIIALNKFNSTDNETKSDKEELVLAIFKSNDWFVKIFSFTHFQFFLELFLKKAKGEKVAAIWNYLKIIFERAFCWNRKLFFFVKLLLAMYKFKKKKRKRNGIGCGRQTSKYLTDKISHQIFNSHANIIFRYI